MTEPVPGGAPLLDSDARRALEAILLVVEEPVDAISLAQVLEAPTEAVEATLRALRAEYAEQGRGFVLRQAAGGWRLYTDPAAAPYVERFVLRGRSGRLSQAALETLAIVAYRQPVTRSRVSEIRGVDADGAIRSLVSRGLVEEVGRDPGPGQPLLYATTSRLLEQLGLDSLSELPPLPSLGPEGPLPPEPAPGGYKAARRALDGPVDQHRGAAAAGRPEAGRPAQAPEADAGGAGGAGDGGGPAGGDDPQ